MPTKRKGRDDVAAEDTISMNDDAPDAPTPLAAAKADLSSLSRVSHRLAMVDTADKLTAVLEKLLPRLIKRIGENHRQQQQTANSPPLSAVLQQIHSKLVEMLSHAMKRVRDDAACKIPCLSILHLLLVIPASEGTSLPTSSLKSVDAFTLNLALTFLTVGVVRCGVEECEKMLPSLLVLVSDSRSLQFRSSSSQQQHYQITHLLITTIELIVSNDSDTKVMKVTSVLPKKLKTASMSTAKEDDLSTTANDTVTASESVEPSSLDIARDLCGSVNAVAAAAYDVLLDVLLYQPAAAGTIPPAGLSQSGSDRLKSSAKWSNERARLIQLKSAILDLVSPNRRFGLFLRSPPSEGSAEPQAENRSGKLNLARTVSLLIVASGDPVQEVAERAASYLKQHLDTARGIAAAADSTILGDPMAVAIELLALCLGQAHAEAALQSSERLGGSSLVGATTASQQQVLSNKRRPVEETTVEAALVSFVSSKILNEYPNLFESDAAATTVLASLAVQVASRSLSTASGSLTKLRAKPYIASAELLNALAIRLSVCYDSQLYRSSCEGSFQQSEQVIQLLARCMSTACGVLAPIATAVSTTSNRIAVGSNDGSIAVRDACYGVIATLSRSQFAVLPEAFIFRRGAASESSCDGNIVSVSVETATMLFGCAANEEERLRPRAVAALDALLAAYCRAYSNATNVPPMDDKVSSIMETTDIAAVAIVTENSNPWLNASTPSEVPSAPTMPSCDVPVSVDRAGLARSLLPLIWTAAQTYQPKASRVAASRWASDLLKELDLSSACHLLCFLAGDTDATAASIARDGLGLPKHSANDDDILAAKSSDYTNAKLPEFGDFAERLFPDAAPKASGRLQRFWDFSLQGKAATLRCGLHCLLNDLYGGEDEAVGLYLSAITKTLREITGEGSHAGNSGTSSPARASVDLLDECSACLLATLSASQYARMQLVRMYGMPAFHAGDMEDLALKANSSKSRRYFAGACGKLFEDSSLWSSDANDKVDAFGNWVTRSHLARSLTTCAQSLTDIEKKHSALGRLHGSSFLGAHVVRAFRLRAANAKNLDRSDALEEWWGKASAVLESLGKGTLNDDDVVSNACADGLTIALSYDDNDAPVLDVRLYQCTASILNNLSKALKKFGHSDTVNPARTSKIARAAGICLAATTTGSGIVEGSSDYGSGSNLGQKRVECVDALLDLLGSMSFRKEEEIGIIVGEALADFADAYSPDNVVWSHPDSSWPIEFSDSFAKQLPPHEQVLYVLLRNVTKASSPHKRTACAPALLACVARGVTSDASTPRRSLVQSLSSHLEEVQKAFLTLLSDPKGTQFSRESSCLGLAACRGLVKSATEPTSGPSADELNHRLLRAFGQTTTFGGSAMMESQAQAAARRARESASNENVDARESQVVESEVGGASGIGEAALGAYREMASASVSLGRHDIMYALLILSVSHPYWLSAEARYRYSASSLLGETSFVGNKTSTFEFRNALRPHLGKLLPRILRACHDPNKQTREQMSALWTGLTGGGAEGRLAISQHLLSTIDALIEDASNKLWRARVGACGALSEIIIGREWSDLGGGGPILSDDDLYGGTAVTAGIRLLRIWKVATRALDDVQGAVRDSGETLARAARALTIRLCDPSLDQKSDGAKQGREEIATHEREATSAAATSLRWLIRHGLNQTCPEATGVCVSTLVEVVRVVRPKILEPSLPALLNSLLMAMSALEPAALNYLQLRTIDQEGLERVRLQLAQTGPLAVALTKCLELIPFVELKTHQRVASELDSALRQSAGFATRAATADAVSTLCSTCPAVFRFSGSSSTNPSVRLLRGFYFASERERGAAAKDKMIHALGNLAALCPASSVRSLALRACNRYRLSTGNNYDPASRRAAAATLRTIAVRASNHFNDGGSGDIWCAYVLPAAYLGRKDTDPKIASLWNEVWDEGGSAANLSDSSPSMSSFGTRLEEKLLPSLVSECVLALQDVSWSRRVAGASALTELCEIGILSPVPRSTQQLSAKAEAIAMLRARRRAEASNIALRECIQLLTKPRLWNGKSEALKAATQLASKWAAAESSKENESDDKVLFGWSEHGTPCPWRPLVIAPGDFVDDLFAGDSWFTQAKIAEDSSGEEPGETPLNDEDDAEKGDWEHIDFEHCDEIMEEAEVIEETVTPCVNETTRSVVTFTGLCRFLIGQAIPSSRNQTGTGTVTVSEEMLPYRTTAFRCLRDLLNSLPPAGAEQRIVIYKHLSPTLLQMFGQGSFDKDVDKREPPVLTAGAINCLEACFWEGMGTSGDAVENADPNELTSILKQAGGKLQPAWTVREAAAQCIAQLALKCNDESIRRHVVVSQMVDSARQALTDRKFWRVRVAGLKILESLTIRAGTSQNPSTEMQLNLEALLPLKEVILGLARSSLSDSESKVTALSSGIITNMAWWP